jgi:trans-aconitate methyltransferase
MTEITQLHYTRLAQKYDDFLYYSPDFIRCLTTKMIEKLRLREEDVLVGLGCGKGMYSLDILKQIKLQNAIIAVDPYAEMLNKIPRDAPFTTLQLDAIAFSKGPSTYDKILMKEAVHHIKNKEELFSNLYQRLTPNGIMLFVHVPPKVQYPLFRKALLKCEKWHADPAHLTTLLEQTGFRVERDAVDYPLAIPKEKYFKMVESCYMSVLSSMSEEEILAGLAEMAKTYAKETVLEFIDHFDYLTAIKV